MSQSLIKGIGGAESTVFVFALSMAAEVILRAIPGLSEFGMETVAYIRLGLYAMACFCLGYWLQVRYELKAYSAGAAFAVGVTLSFVIRILGDEADGSLKSESVSFTTVLAMLNWLILFVGALFAGWRNRAAGHAAGDH